MHVVLPVLISIHNVHKTLLIMIVKLIKNAIYNKARVSLYLEHLHEMN